MPNSATIRESQRIRQQRAIADIFLKEQNRKRAAGETTGPVEDHFFTITNSTLGTEGLKQTAQVGSPGSTTAVVTGAGEVARRKKLALDAINNPPPELPFSHTKKQLVALNQQLGTEIQQAEKTQAVTQNITAAVRPQARDVQAINELVFRGLRKRRGSKGVPRSVALLGSAEGDRGIL